MIFGGACRNKLIAVGLISAVAASVCSTAWADSRTVRFGAAVSNSCTLTTVSDGILRPNVASQNLASTNSGGRASRLVANTSSRGFRVRTIAPTAFTVGNSTSTRFAARYTVSGATVVNNVVGTIVSTLNRGINNIAVNLTATRTTGIFPNGTYEAVVIVRCD